MRPRPVVVVLLAAALVAGVSSPAAAASPSGADVSWPQCGSVLPADAAFGIVGVNAGTATTTNPCVADQLAWASARSARPDVYVNTANPAPAAASWWPAGDLTRRGRAVRSPYGQCVGAATRACSWVYGASLAWDDVETRGVAVGATGRWWLDVEVQNSWSTSTTRNRAVLEGMTTTLRSAGARVGLYALDHEFRDLIGPVPSSSVLAALPSWVAGASGQAAAARRCSGAPHAAGRTLLVQWVEAGVDRDLRCLEPTAAPEPRITGNRTVGRTVTVAAGRWRPGSVHLAYRWNRDGKAVAGATHRTYRLRHVDAGHRITATVTGTTPGYSRTARTSAGFRPHR